MAFAFKLPDIGEGVHEGEIVKWHVAAGQAVTADAPMVDVMTDKVTVEITAPVSGVVEAIHFPVGAVVNVGAVIININDTGEATSTPAAASEKVPQPVLAAATSENGQAT